MPKILLTGLYDESYPRNQQIIAAVKKVDEVTEWPLKSRFWGGLKLFLRLAFTSQFKYVVLMQPIHFVLPFLWPLKLLSRRPKIILDAFTSLYDTNVLDRGLAGKNSLKAKFYQWLDGLVGRVGEAVFFDTEEHKNYFNLPANLPQVVLPVVPDNNLLNSIKSDKHLLKPDKINVLFYGKYITLQSVETIIEAAKILHPHQELHFTLIGSGQDYQKVKTLAEKYKLENVTFLPRQTYHEIIATLKAADIALGVFGGSEKVQRVIPNKVLEALTAGIPLITGESGAVKRYFKNNEHLSFVPPSNPQALAQKITDVVSNLPPVKQLALAGQALAKQEFNEEILVTRLRELLAQL